MNILTFDIEEWFHTQFDPKLNVEKEWDKYESRIERNMNLIFELLEKHNQKGTFFCVGWVARKYPQILKQIDAYGHEIGSHSDMHGLAYLQTKEEFKNDFERAIKSIEDVIGKKVTTYRAPAFSIKRENRDYFDIIIENGIKIDCSVFPGKRDYGGFENFNEAKPCIIKYNGVEFKEFPMNTYDFSGRKIIFSGGGYFRFFPYWLIKKMFKSSPYVMAYYHPRDFDPDQPMIPELPLNRKFKSYYGLKGAYKKFEKLLDEFEFIDLKTADEQIDWNSVKRVSIN